jgi:hypothetical protein
VDNYLRECIIRIFGKISDVDYPALQHRSAYARPASGSDYQIAQIGVEFWQYRERRGDTIDCTVASGDQRPVSFAQPRRRFDQRVEHRSQIKGRATDDLKHIARGGLVFQRLFEITDAITQFAEQPRVSPSQ